jgi:cytochrome P450
MSNCPEVPGPAGHALTGNLALLKRDILSLLEQLPREYGDIVRLRFGGYRALLLSHPAYVEQVLVTQGQRFEKPPRFRRIVRTAFGNGIFAAEGSAWQQQRSALQSAIATIDHQHHGRIVRSIADRVLAGWDDEEGDLPSRMVDLALAVRAKTGLGVDRADTLCSIHDALRGFMEYYTACLRSPLHWPLWVPTALNRRTNGGLEMLSQAIDDQIRRANEAPEAEDSLLGRLLIRGGLNGMARHQLRDELATWILTGTETTANTLAWTCYLLAQHPDEQERLLGDLPAGASAALHGDDLLKVKRLAWVLAESMRLYPQAYLIGRKAKAAFEIDGHTFPRRTTVILNQWAIGRDPRWYEKPLTFDPDRWSPDRSGRALTFAYFPYGGGTRGCLGRSLSTVELPRLLAALVQRFRFALSAGTRVRPNASLTLRPECETGALVMRRR